MATTKKAPTVKKSVALKRAAKTPAPQASDAIDKQLARYQSMRDFTITAEPRGRSKTSINSSNQQLPFVIQKHAASHLHYDFRLGWNGVLKSWACAKGPSYDPADRRLAVQLEDHPMEYGGFEGIIPAGQYGGGTVMLWDQGTWTPQPGHTDVDAGLRDGSLKFTLHGTKLKGNWTLVRMGGKAANEKKPNWLLIKEHDDFERTADQKPITDEAPNSVVTERSLDQIAASEDHVWNSKDTARGNAWHRNDPQSSPQNPPKESLPTFIEPQLASQTSAPVQRSGWLHELKLDGYRIQCRLHQGKVKLLTRTGLDWTHRMPSIAAAAATLPAQSALLDGEVVVLGEDGRSSFADLQAAFQNEAPAKAKPLTYFVFDLLHLDGHNLRGLPLIGRKALLSGLLERSGEAIQFSEHLDADASTVFQKACELQAEGIISKRADARYTSGRSTSWLKLKCIHEQEFVIGGFTLPARGHSGLHGIGSLLLGYYEGPKKLIYAGRTGTGFTLKTHKLLRMKLEALRQSKSPFHLPSVEASKGAIWTEPALVAQVRFATWTADGLLRQASFQGLREDKPVKEVRREETSAKPTIVRHGTTSTVAARRISSPEPERGSLPKTIRLTHPDKILDPESKLTKQQLAEYYWAIAPYMLPYIADRPLSVVRCPEGSTKPCFFQKHTNTMLPPGVQSIDVPDRKTGKIEPYITLSTPEALAGLAQMGVLELHPWGSRNEDLEHPDRIIIDLDPDVAISWRVLADAAAQVRDELKKIGLESFLKSTGGKGLHVVVPIQPEHDWAAIKQFAHTFVLGLERSNPALYLTKMTKSARTGKIYLDYLRNERGATAVAVFSPRARAGAPVSLPLDWKDLKWQQQPLFHITDYEAWKSRLSQDPWSGIINSRQRLKIATTHVRKS